MKTYEQIRKHRSDFIVRYHLYSPSEGGRKVTYQRLRCDFMEGSRKIGDVVIEEITGLHENPAS